MGAGGPVIEYETDQEDRFSPIISSSCKIPYLVENFLDSTFIDQLRNVYQERQVYVHIYRSTQSQSSSVAPLWSGFLIMDIGSGVDQSFPYVQTLKFVDGLSLLKDIDFVDLGVSGGSPPFEERVQGNYAQENMYYGPATYIFWIREILAKSGAALTNQGASQNYGFTTSVNWYNGEMNATGQSSDPLNKTKCAVSMFHRKDDQGVFYPDNCYTVLKEILRHWGARITYWKHEFWIVQIPEYITTESGTIGTPVNNNSRLYSNTGAFQGSQNHLGSTFYTRYEQTIENDKISKLTGTKYDYLPLLKQVNADFLSFSSKNYFGGFPFGSTATTQEVFQGTINSPSAADFLYLSIPLDWSWDLTNAPNFPNGHTNGWWCAIKFNFYASDGTTTYYLQYNSAGGNYFWVDSATWTPLGNRAPKYIISSKLANVTGHIGFDQQIPFEDENGNAISMSGAWSFFLDIDNYGTGNSNPGSFYINFSGYGSPQRMRNPGTAIQLPANSGVMSGTVSWSNTLQDAQGVVTPNLTNLNPAGFNAGSAIDDLSLDTTSPFMGLLQTLNNSQSSSYGLTINSMNTTSNATKANSEQFNFGRLVWGDSLEYAPSSLQVFDGANYVNTDANGEWGRGVLTGNSTFTKMLIDEFLYGQTKIIIAPSMRLAVGVENKNEDQSGTIRPRYVNPIGILRETRDAADPVYFFRRGSFYTLLDEWDYEGFEIIRNVVTTTTQTNGIGNLGGSQAGNPASTGMSPSPMVQALSQNSPLAYIRTTIPATGSNVAVNGNFNTAVGWSLGTGWSIDTTAKKAKFAATGSTSELTQSVLTQGLTYQVNFKVEVTAGTLLVKAGTSGTSQSITSSGDYSIYLDCEGSSLIKFQAGTTFTGNITYITLRDQKSLSSVPIESIGTAVFKTGDTFNLINSNDDTILPLTVTSNQGSGDTTISVSSTPLYEDIDNGSYLLINQDDLSEQYQNKTKGTVAGFGIDADGISKGGIEITGWLNSDTMSGAAITNVPTALSVKNYVDGQVGANDTLAEVLANGNTTGGTNISVNDDDKITFGTSADLQIYHDQNNSYIDDVGVGNLLIRANNLQLQRANGSQSYLAANTGAEVVIYHAGNKKFETSSIGANVYGKLLIGTTVDSGDKLQVLGSAKLSQSTNTNINLMLNPYSSALGTNYAWNLVASNSAGNYGFDIKEGSSSVLHINNTAASGNNNIGIGTTSPSEKLEVSGARSKFNGILIGENSEFIQFPNDAKIAVGDNDHFIVSEGGAEIMRAGGGNRNVGIGISSPNAKLDVTADLEYNWAGRFENTNSAGYGILAKIAGTSANERIFEARVGSSAKMLITGDGNTTFSGLVSGITPTAAANFTTKAYVDQLVSETDTLQEVTDNGNTTSNSITFAGGTSTDNLLISNSSESFLTVKETTNNNFLQIYQQANNSYIIAGKTSGTPTQSLLFYSGGGEKMELTSTGNLLIGTTVDSGNKLTVKGTIGIQRSVNTAESTINMEGNFNFVAAGGYSHRFEQNGTEVARIVPNGNLLLGTTVDSAKLVVKIGSANDVIQRWETTNGLAGLLQTSSDFSEFILSQPGGNPFIVLNTNGNSYFNGGNVGIGTTNPTTLSVNTSSLSISSARTDLTGAIFLKANDVNKAQIYWDSTGQVNDTLSGAIKWRTGSSERMRITSSGSILIGTTTDSLVYRLDVFGKARVQSVFELDDVLTLNQISTPADPASGKSSIYMDSADGAIKVKINVGGTVVTRTIASFE